MLFRSRKSSEPVRVSRRRFLWLAGGLPAFLMACGKTAPNPVLQSGMSLPLLELPVLDGGSYRLGELSGPCLINFWATWCPPCRAEMASLNRLHRDYAGRSLLVLAVSVDEDSHLVREFIRQTRLDFPILLDPRAKVAAPGFGVSAFPTSFLIDRQARVGGVWVGERNWDAADTRAAIERLILS